MKKLLFTMMMLLVTTIITAQEYNAEWPHGTEFTAYATPNEGWEFLNWTENNVVVSTENPYVFTVTGPVNLIANFKRLYYIIQINVNPEGSGVIEGDGAYPPGEEVMLHAFPNDNYKFNNYLDLTSGDVFNDNPLYFIPTENKIMQANFVSISSVPKDWLWVIIIGTVLLILFFITKHELAVAQKKKKNN